MTNVSLSDTNADLTNAALIIQDMQVDAVGENGASSDSGAFQHCQDQNCISNIANLAKKFREKIYLLYISILLLIRVLRV